MPPYPAKWTDLTENPDKANNVRISIQNNEQTEKEFILSIRLKNLNTGSIAETDDLNFGICKTIGPGENLELIGSDIDSYINLDEAAVNGQKVYNIDLTDPDFEEGMYEFCVRALDCNNRTTVLSNSVGNCAFFEVRYSDPPVNISICNQTINLEENPQLFINWQHDIPGMIDGYMVTIIDVEEGVNPADAMEFPRSGNFFFEQITESQSLVLSVPDQLELEKGKKYAIQIQAIDERAQFNFRNNGKSEVCVFEIAAEGIGPPKNINICNDSIDVDQTPILAISWEHDSTRATYYEVLIADVKEGKIAEESILTANAEDIVYRATTTNNFSFPDIPGQVELKKGKKYAIVINAYTKPTGVETSKVCTFFTKGIAIGPPRNINICDDSIAVDELPGLAISWDHNSEGVKDYQIIITQVKDGKTPQESILEANAADLVYQGTSKDNYAFLDIPEKLVLEKGKTYAIVINAYTEDRGVEASKVCTFYIKSELESGDFIPHYPLAGDYIPFDMFPVVIQFQPYATAPNKSDYKYHEFSFSMTESDELIGQFGIPIENDGSNNWPRGPLVSQKRNLEKCNFKVDPFPEVRASLLAYNHTQYGLPYFQNAIKISEDKYEVKFTNGSKYDVRFKGKIKTSKRSQTSILEGNLDYIFHVGMAKPLLNYPENQDTVQKGIIKFGFKPSENRPRKLFPDYYIYRANPNEDDCDAYNGHVFQKCVLQVRDSTSKLIHEQFWTFGDTLKEDYQFRSFFKENGERDPEKVSKLIEELYPEELTSMDSILNPGVYQWQVVWVARQLQDEDAFIFYVSSDTFSFVVVENLEEELAKKDTARCSDICEIPLPSNVKDTLFKVGDTLQIGQFEMKVTQVSKSDGLGTIKIPWLNNVVVNVKYSGIKANTEKQVFAGKAEAVKDNKLILKTSVAGTSLDLNQIPSDQLKNAIRTAKKVSQFFQDDVLNLPLALDQQYEGEEFLLGIMDMVFTPGKAELQAVMSIDLPFVDGIADQVLSFGSQACFGPNGLGASWKDFLMFRIGDLTIPDINEYEIVIKGATGKESISELDTTKVTYLDWDCKGFRRLHLAAEVSFSRNLILPVDKNGKVVDGDKKVKGFFRALIDNPLGLLAQGNMESRFVHPERKSIIFTAKDMVLDLSDIENPPGIKFPKGYDHPSINKNEMANTWQGFYLKELSIQLDSLFGKSVKRGVSVTNSIIDRSGISSNINVLDLLPWDEGEGVDGWGISMDTLRATVVQNSWREFSVMGKLGAPVLHEDDHLKYKALANLKEENAYVVSIFADSTLRLPIALAEMKLDKNSNITYEKKKGKHNFSAKLNGYLFITDESVKSIAQTTGNLIPSLDLDSIRFEYFEATGDNSGEGLKFSKASPQKFMGGFPISLDDIGFGLKNGKPSFFIVPQITLVDGINAFNAKTKLSVVGAWEGIKRRHLKVVDVTLDAIAVDAAWSGIGMKGSLEFYEENNKEGFKADNFQVKLPILKAPISFNADFGTYGAENKKQSTFGSDQYFSYWYVDGMLPFPAGVNIFAGFSMYGLGGGAYYNMNLVDTATYQYGAGKPGSKSSASYEPKKGSMGVKLATIIGTTGNPDAFNMDVGLAVEFSSSFGLKHIQLTGDSYVMTSLKKRDNPKIYGKLNARYDFAKEILDSDLEIKVNIESQGVKMVGGHTGKKMAEGKFYINGPEDKWFFNIGTPDKRGLLKVDLFKGKASVNFDSYLMVGHDVPSEIPDPPAGLMQILNGGAKTSSDQGSIEGTAQYQKQHRTNLQSYKDAKGFAFGGGLHVNPKTIDFLIFYAQIEAWLGYDFNLTKTKDPVFCTNTGEDRGMNDWYGQGQLYAGLRGNMGIKVDIGGWNKKISFLDFAAALRIYGGTPSPTFFAGNARIRYSVLGGTVTGSSSFAFSFGKTCIPEDSSPLTGISVIGDTYPNEQNNQNISPFADLAVTYNLPVNTDIEIPEFDKVGKPVKLNTYRFIPSYEVKLNSNGKLVAIGEEAYDNSYNQVLLTPQEPLNEKTAYNFMVKVQAEQLIDNVFTPVEEDGKVWEEKVSVGFSTDIMPDYLPFNQVVKNAYPDYGQRFFLKGETDRGLGFIQFKQNIAKTHLFQDVDNSGLSFDYYHRFISNPGMDTLEIPYNVNTYDPASNTIPFDVSHLKKTSIYLYEIVRKPDPFNRFAALANVNIPTVLKAQASVSSVKKEFTSYGKVYDYQANINQNVVGKLPDKKYFEERVVLSYVFGTSKYDHFRDKVPETIWKRYPTSSSRGYTTYTIAYLELSEGVDKYDIELKRGDPIDGPGIIRFYEFNLNPRYRRKGINPDPMIKDIGYPWHFNQVRYISRHNKKYKIKVQIGFNQFFQTVDLRIPTMVAGLRSQVQSSSFYGHIYNRTKPEKLLTMEDFTPAKSSSRFTRFRDLSLSASGSSVTKASTSPGSTSSSPKYALRMTYRIPYYLMKLNRSLSRRIVGFLNKRKTVGGKRVYYRNILADHDRTFYRRLNRQKRLTNVNFSLESGRTYPFLINYAYPLVPRNNGNPIYRSSGVKGSFVTEFKFIAR